LADHDAPSPNPQSQELVKDGTVTFHGVYQRWTGTLGIQVTPVQAGWSLSGPDGLHLEDTGTTTILHTPTGDYSITWHPLADWSEPSSQTLTLTKDELTTLSGIYLAPTPLVSNITPAGYSTDLLQPGTLVYGDRQYTFATPIPSDLLNQFYIKMNNADKNSTSLSLGFDVNQPVWVIVALDSRITVPPQWMQGWSPRADGLTTTDSNPGRILFATRFGAGHVTLGANRDDEMPTGNSMYTVIILPARNRVKDWKDYR
jgi:hypothetical protein